MSRTTADKVYARVMVALADPIREEILRLLLAKSDGLPFYKIKNMLGLNHEATLYRNLRTLRWAGLIEIIIDPKNKRGGHYYYAITQIGRDIIPNVPDAIHKAISDAIASKSIPEYYTGENGPLGALPL